MELLIDVVLALIFIRIALALLGVVIGVVGVTACVTRDAMKRRPANVQANEKVLVKLPGGHSIVW